MPHLTDAADQLGHLSAAVRGHKHWVILTDLPEGHDGLVNLARMLLAFNLPPDDLCYGTAEVGFPGDENLKVISFLTLPKAFAPAEVVNFLLAGVGIESHIQPDGEQDLVALSAVGGHSDIQRFVEEIYAGAVRVGPAPAEREDG
jgi:hypothetical protein